MNLKNATSKVVIEGFISNGESPVLVKITKSQGYFDQSGFSSVNDAKVQLEFLSGKETLHDKGGGYYVSSKSLGVSSAIYTLKVGVSGETFAATVQLPPPVLIDTIYFKPGLFQSDSLNVIVEFRDPPKTENFYRIKIYRNRRLAINDFYLTTDAFSDGTKMVLPIYYRYFAPKDTIVVELLNMERSSWKYIKGLSETIQQGVNSQAPGNPVSNFTGGALGCFGAWSTASFMAIAGKPLLKK